MTGLQAGRYPNVEHADVDQSDNNGCTNHDVPRPLTVWDNNTDTVDDNLKKQLDLNTPPEHCATYN
jgi:hypothetical protein